MHSEPRPTVEVAAGLVFREHKLLITRRRAEAHLGGLWEFPGGKREPGETFTACLVRELAEELGIEVEVGSLLDCVTHAYPDKVVRIEFFRCRWQRNEPQALHCAEFKWITGAELADHQFPEADLRLIQRLNHSPDLWR
jgi:8-oxo-dGTP diphosphatase